jgi:hypothetical protein
LVAALISSSRLVRSMRDKATEEPHSGTMIVVELERASFTLEWSGTFAQRIYIPANDWKCR